jgi:hypothetical protein
VPGHLGSPNDGVVRALSRFEQESDDGLPGANGLDDFGYVLDSDSTVGNMIRFDENDRTVVAEVEAGCLTAACDALGEARRGQLALELGKHLERTAFLTRWSRYLVRTPVVADEQVVITGCQESNLSEPRAKRQAAPDYSNLSRACASVHLGQAGIPRGAPVPGVENDCAGRKRLTFAPCPTLLWISI